MSIEEIKLTIHNWRLLRDIMRNISDSVYLGDETELVEKNIRGVLIEAFGRSERKHEDTVEVLRLVRYVGPRSWVEKTVAKSLQGTKYIDDESFIIAADLQDYPTVLKQLRTEPEPKEAVRHDDTGHDTIE